MLFIRHLFRKVLPLEFKVHLHTWLLVRTYTPWFLVRIYTPWLQVRIYTPWPQLYLLLGMRLAECNGILWNSSRRIHLCMAIVANEEAAVKRKLDK